MSKKNLVTIEEIKDAMWKAGFTSFEIVSNPGFTEIVTKQDIEEKEGDTCHPILWKIVKELDINWGCGATFFHQISSKKISKDCYGKFEKEKSNG